MVLRDVGIGQNIQSSPYTLEEATVTQATEVDARDAVCVQVAGTEYTCLLYDFQDPLSTVHGLALYAHVTMPREI